MLIPGLNVKSRGPVFLQGRREVPAEDASVTEVQTGGTAFFPCPRNPAQKHIQHCDIQCQLHHRAAFIQYKHCAASGGTPPCQATPCWPAAGLLCWVMVPLMQRSTSTGWRRYSMHSGLLLHTRMTRWARAAHDQYVLQGACLLPRQLKLTPSTQMVRVLL